MAKLKVFILFLLVLIIVPQKVSAATCSAGSCGAVNQSCFDDGSCNSGLNCGVDTSGPISISNRCLPIDLNSLGQTIATTGDNNPIPNPPVACNVTKPNEFQSLRPYQASATCKSETANYASFCGNDLTIKDSITVSYSGGQDCKLTGNQATCNYVVPVSKTITMNLSGASLPIMGNTENTINYKNKEDKIDDATKLSEYVSWYLGGVTNKKEYPDRTDDVSIVNFSGPLAKLIPQEIQNYERFKQIAQAKTSRHDQIVVCTKKETDTKLTKNFFKWALEHLGFGQTVATECPDGTEMRLTDWDGHISIIRDLENAGISLLDTFLKMVPWMNNGVIEQAVSNNKAWPYRTPPVSWGVDPDGDPFTDITYQKAYNEWRGKSCILIPFPQLLICTEDFLVPNSYAEMYQYIPLSSTEDIKGNIAVDRYSTASTASPGVVLSKVGFSDQFGIGQASSTLFFPHLEEADQLGSLLQDTYAPKGVNKTAQSTDISNDLSCKEIEVRSNAGDNLFASQIRGILSYTATFSCTYDLTTSVDEVCLNNCLVRALNPSTCNKQCERTGSQNCTKDVYVRLSTTTNTPKVDDIWSRLVAGSMSVFKRIFPKTNTEGSVGQIMDIAGSTNITYEGDGISQTNTDLKIPHVGGISEYFLKGIQTALRPKGFGNTISFANVSTTPETSSESICDASCNKNPTSVNMDGVKESFIADGVRWSYGTAGKPRIEKFDAVVAAAKAAGVDPIFILSLWIHESGASNYSAMCTIQGHNNPNSEYCQQIRDFGIDDPDIITKIDSKGNIVEDHFMDQLNAVVNLPGYYYGLCNNKSTAQCPIEYFYAEYRLGQCNPTNVSNGEYGGSMKRIYNILTSQKFPCYPIKISDN